MGRKLRPLPVRLGRNHKIAFYGEVHRTCVEGRGTEWEKALSKTLLERDVQIEILNDLPIEPILEALFIPIRVAWATHKKIHILCHKNKSARIISFTNTAISANTIDIGE